MSRSFPFLLVADAILWCLQSVHAICTAQCLYAQLAICTARTATFACTDHELISLLYINTRPCTDRSFTMKRTRRASFIRVLISLLLNAWYNKKNHWNHSEKRFCLCRLSQSQSNNVCTHNHICFRWFVVFECFLCMLIFFFNSTIDNQEQAAGVVYSDSP